MESLLPADNSRLRVIKHLRKQATVSKSFTSFGVARAAATGFEEEDDPNKPKELELGLMQLYSFYTPSLVGGVYDIIVEQTITHPDFAHPDPNDGPKTPPATAASTAVIPSVAPTPLPKSKEMVLRSLQKFNVNSPRFVLPPGIVHQTYPPQGLGDHNNVLPHIIFEDPHLPWEQEASHIDHVEETTDTSTTTPGGQPTKPKVGRNRVPWLALLVFSEDELKLTSDKLLPRSQGGFFPEGTPEIPSKSTPIPGASGPPNPLARQHDQNTFAVKLTMNEYLGLGDVEEKDVNGKPVPVRIPVRDNSDEKILRDQQVDVIFVQKDQFHSLFCTYNESGSRVALDPLKPSTPDLHRYKYMAHVRNVNTKNMAGAGVDDDGLFSVIHAHRTGPLDLKDPKPMIVHLVTLEGIEDHMKLPLNNAKSHVALVSLYSWSYLCLPPLSVNFVDAMIHIGDTITDGGDCLLRPTKKLIASLDQNAKVPSLLSTQLRNRMNDGFVLQRHMLQTGEETVSFYRGPLTPTYVAPISASWWPYHSNFSTDYQIIDKALGIVDISYSSAWQLGRTLGIADQAFSAALTRLRGSIQRTARRGAMKDKFSNNGSGIGKPKAAFFAGLGRMVDNLDTLSASDAGAITVDPSQRFVVTNLQENSPPAGGDHQALLNSHITKTVAHLTSAKDLSTGNPVTLTSDNDEVFIPFNDISVPTSGDWKIVQSWIMSNLYLKNIPAHYLIPDPAFLPKESIRFFYIDPNWMDALIDGALSIGNHLDQKNDVVRQALKNALNIYLKTPYNSNDAQMNYNPQVPCFGFLLRSSVVQAFPNLEVHAPWPDAKDPNTPTREPVLRLETIEKDVLFCLFDRMPAGDHWAPDVQITISQPPHQQCFRLGAESSVTADFVEMSYRYMSSSGEKPLHDPIVPSRRFDPHKPVAIVKWKKGGAPDVPELEEGATQSQKDDHARGESLLTTSQVAPQIYDWDTRNIIFPAFATACNKILQTFIPLSDTGKKVFDDDEPTSAVSGTMLTSYISQIKISLPKPTNTPGSVPPKSPPDTITTPRKIRIQKDDTSDPSTWEKVPTDDNTGPSIDSPPSKKPTPDNTHSSQPYYPPSRLTPAGYINKNSHPDIPLSQRTQIDKSNKNAVLNNKDVGSQFVIKIFALHQSVPEAGKNAQINVYTNQHDVRNVPIDLVVTLRPLGPNDHFQQDTLHNLQLYSVEVDIPLGDTAIDLCSTYDGPGGKMLSNPRFNVHVTLMEKGSQNVARFTLVPRAVARLVPLKGIQDLSFVIWKVVPNSVASGNVVGTKGAVKIVVTENYRRMDWGLPYDNIGVANYYVTKVLVP